MCHIIRRCDTSAVEWKNCTVIARRWRFDHMEHFWEQLLPGLICRRSVTWFDGWKKRENTQLPVLSHWPCLLLTETHTDLLECVAPTCGVTGWSSDVWLVWCHPRLSVEFPSLVIGLPNPTCPTYVSPSPHLIDISCISLLVVIWKHSLIFFPWVSPSKRSTRILFWTAEPV